MSLLIVGSCSRITQSIILTLAKQQTYPSITLLDLLPTYNHHQRYYRLRRALNDQKTPLTVSIQKIISTTYLAQQISNHQDLLFVTHDYFYNVTSKTKLMELTANYAKNKKNVVFATPIQYDHFGLANPEQQYLQSQQKVRSINPNATFIRSDIQDNTQLYAYLFKSKKIWQQKLLQTPASFRPKVARSSVYSQEVARVLKEGSKGQTVCVRGNRQVSWNEVSYNRDVEDHENDHQVDNIRLIVSKYKGPEEKHSRLVIA